VEAFHASKKETPRSDFIKELFKEVQIAKGSRRHDEDLIKALKRGKTFRWLCDTQ
jgi:hypothetical protein